MSNSTQLNQVLREVLSRVKPTEEDEHKIGQSLNVVLERLKGLDAQVHGSFRKGTWLKGDADVDVFVFFPKEVGKEYLRTEALKLLLERLKGLEVDMAYAEHPYLITRVEGVEVDVVPGLKVESGEEALTAVDRTPFHTEYVLSHLSDEQKDEVRLLKRFLKGIGVYGAEIKVQGFSGYVSELLVVKYGTFVRVLEEARKWRNPVKVELVKPKKEFDSPVIIPDPVDPRRNAAAAVSLKSLATFVIASHFFLKDPSISFFFPPEVKDARLMGDVLVTKVYIEEKGVEDVLWGQVYRSIERIRNELKAKGYRVIDVKGYGDSSVVTIAVQLESRYVGKYKLNQGPSFYLISSVEDFVEKNENVWVGEDGKLYSVKERKDALPEEIVKASLTLKYKHRIEQYWLEEEPEEPCLRRFLKKTPTWLK
ncbi:MAG: CCA tRNA nucleotidyltransferase [Candidatus Aramenus sp.]|jgi:tRNA nucleotidyltransferase (CCA-adding enzyme)|nr:CCA tRNA nucleotidyltransferase [Candidatus Aramenus sp.]